VPSFLFFFPARLPSISSFMQDQLSALLAKAASELPAVVTRPDFEAAKARYVGPNGEFTALMKQMGSVPKEQKPVVGKLVNEAKTALQAHLDAALARIEAAALAAQLGPAVDPTLPSPDRAPGTQHPLTLVREEMTRILRKVGFTVVGRQADGQPVYVNGMRGVIERTWVGSVRKSSCRGCGTSM
jgi:phenylalanyl-tRNA synthetase alpha subunit